MKKTFNILFALLFCGAAVYGQSQYTVNKPATGTNTYAASITGVSSYGTPGTFGITVKLQFANANTGAATININGIAAVAIQKKVSGTLTALSAGDIKAGDICTLSYTGSVFQLEVVEPAGGGGGGAVSSVFSRTGAVVATSGDYTGSQVTNTPNGTISSTTVQNALNELDTDKQGVDADLTTISGLSPSANDIMQYKSGAWANRTPAQVKTDLVLVKADVGLGNVDNTSDVNKPVSTAQQTALDGKVNLNSANTYGDGFLQTFNPNNTNPGLVIGSNAARPSVPVEGAVFFNSTTKDVEVYIDGTWTGMTRGEDVTDATTARTITDTDRNKTIIFTNASPITITLNSTPEVGTGVFIWKAAGSGDITLAPTGTLDAFDDQLLTDRTGAWVQHLGGGNYRAVGNLGVSGGGGGGTWGSITGTLSDQTDLQAALDAKQPLDADLTQIAGATYSNDDFIQKKAGNLTNRTIAQVKTDLGLTGTNSGDQTSIVGITGTKSQFNTALTNGDFAYTDWPSVAKTASFQAALTDAGTNCYHITSGSVTITFPSMTGLDGIQWGFYVEPAADAVFDFGAVTANGARHLPDSSLVYVRYDGIGNKFIVAGTNPVTAGGGGSGTVTSVGLTLGTTGTDLGVSGSPVTTSGSFTLNVPDASATARGVITTGAQTVAGSKTFSSTIVGSITGNSGTATALATGRTIAITGDLAYTSPSFDGTGNVTAAGTLATVNSNVGTFGSATQAGTFTVNGKGLITAASNVTVTPAIGSVTGLGTGIATALAVNTGSAGAPVLFNGAGGTPSSLTLTNATGLTVPGGGTGVASLTAYAPIFGGTTSTGSVQSGTVGSSGQVLTSNGAGALPTFQNASAGFANPMTTTGDIIYGASGGTATRLAGASGVLHSTGAAAPTWANVNLASEVTGDLPLANIVQIGANTVLGNAGTSTADASALSEASIRDIVFNTKKYDRIYSTFLGGTSEFLSSTSGTGATISYSATGAVTNHNGIVNLSAGTTTTGLAFLRTGNLSAINLAVGEISYDAAVKTEANLSDGTDTYILYSGLSNDNAAEPAHGVYFRYTHGTNSGKWQFISRNSSTETAVDTGITVAASTFYRTTIIINAAGTSAEGFIDGTSIGTISTNIPSTNPIGITTGIRKTAGTANRQYACDFIDTIIELTSPK